MHDAKDRLDKLGRTMLQQLNVAFADEVAELKKEVARLEKRVAKLEKAATPKGSPDASGTASGDA
jgi:ubiquinone biosynthesis protein UbiJ